jgi:hypothetical protein
MREAIVLQRAFRAAGPSAHAHRRAQIHDGLRVRGDAVRGRVGIGHFPQPRNGRGLVGRSVYRVVTREHALHVPVEDRMTLIVREREDRAGGRPSNARQLHHGFDRPRKFAGMRIAHGPRGAQQIAGARVIPEPGPQMQHFVVRRVGE